MSRARSPAAAGGTMEVHAKQRTLLRRWLDALIASRMRKAEREIEEHLRHVSDDVLRRAGYRRREAGPGSMSTVRADIGQATIDSSMTEASAMFTMRKANPRQVGAVAAAVLAPSLLFGLTLLLVDPAEPEAIAADAQCESADRAATARIRPLLDHADRQGTRTLERAVLTLSAARSHCSYGRVELALRNYAELERSLPQ